MRTITSRHNPFYKQLWRLANSSRTQTQLLLEGPHLCAAWLTHFGPPEAVIIAQDQRHSETIQNLLQKISAAATAPSFPASAEDEPPAVPITEQSCLVAPAPVPHYLLPPALFNELSDVVSPQGVLFLVGRPQYSWPGQITGNCLLLDRIQDPGNLGTILRTAAAVNIHQVFLTTGTVNPWAAKVLRSAQGAHFHLAIFEHIDVAQWFRTLRIPLAVTVLEGGESLYQADLNSPMAWAFGNESRGVARSLVERAQYPLTIPHHPQVESLNVAVAAAVCLFEQHRQKVTAHK